jgi:hypothetical protein
MAKYVLLYSGGAMAATQAERDKANQAWGAWFGKLGKVKSVASDGKVKDGAIGERANGYSIVEAASVDQAAELAKSCPVLVGGGKVTVYETFSAM